MKDPIEELDQHSRDTIALPSDETPAEWCCANVEFDEEEYRGPFATKRAEYLIEPINDFANKTITDEVLCWGSQSKKTGLLMGGIAWTMRNDPSQVFWVMPTKELARLFSRKRLQTMLKKSRGTHELIPTGNRRHDFSLLDMTIGSSGIILVGSNSPGSLSSTPSRLIILDEVDKFDEGGRGEADAVDLAEQRCKNATFPQRWKTSTPTLVSGLIWQHFLKGDQRRYFVPCPLCGKFIVLAWSKAYTVFQLTGNEAFVKWDKEARRANGTWDMDRVVRSARAECPHCAGHIRDGHKTKMLPAGEWRATAAASPAFRSRHLPSLYAAMPETNFGRLAVKFLEKKGSLLGLQGFINGDLAEPYQAQDTIGQRVEIVKARIETTAEWKPLLTVDYQEKSPHFWYVVRQWNAGKSQAIAAGSVNTWEELEAVQKAHKVPDVGTFIDSGHASLEVYSRCALRSEFYPRQDALPLAIGWTPMRGTPARTTWKHPDGTVKPWGGPGYTDAAMDPFSGTVRAGRCSMQRLEFASNLFKDLLVKLRRGQDWSVSDTVATEEYWRHLNAEFKAMKNNKRGYPEEEWRQRPHWPNHMLDCELEQIVAAASFGMLKIE